jgi:hypothetical protein
MKSLPNILFAALILLFSCDSNDEIIATAEELTYFPLEVGNRWEYEPISPQAGVAKSAVFTIVSQGVLDGKEYFAMETKRESADGLLSVDTIHYRMDARGYVYALMSYQKEVNLFRLGAAAGTAWLMENSLYDEMKVTVSVSDVTIDDMIFHQAKNFDYNVPQVIDEEHWYTLAKGVGIIRYGNAWGFNYKLKNARIGGVDF